MRQFLFIAFVLSAKLTAAQVVSNTAQQKGTNRQPIRLDTIRIQVPKAKGLDDLNTRLPHFKMKTPMYNTMLTGTHAPGDVNTGINRDYQSNPIPETTDAQKIRTARDSANNIQVPAGSSPQ